MLYKHYKEKPKNIYEWLANKLIINFNRYLRVPTAWYQLRNYTKVFIEKRSENHSVFKRIQWRICNPLKIEYEKRISFQNCEDCRTHGLLFEKTLDHAKKWRHFYRYIWSKKFHYHYTTIECEDRLFQPLEDYLSSGGQEGSSMFGGENGHMWNEKNNKPVRRIVNLWGIYYE
jgi:hypothetical protein